MRDQDNSQEGTIGRRVPRCQCRCTPLPKSLFWPLLAFPLSFLFMFPLRVMRLKRIGILLQFRLLQVQSKHFQKRNMISDDQQLVLRSHLAINSVCRQHRRAPMHMMQGRHPHVRHDAQRSAPCGLVDTSHASQINKEVRGGPLDVLSIII